MTNEDIAIELTKIYMEEVKDAEIKILKTQNDILGYYKYFLQELKKKGGVNE